MMGEKWLLWPILFRVISPSQQAEHLTGRRSACKRWELALPEELCTSPEHLALPRRGQGTRVGLPDLSRSELKLLPSCLVLLD